MLNFINVHIQAGGSDCGLFAIANTTALPFDNLPGNFQYHQENMWQHLWQCFESVGVHLMQSLPKIHSVSTVYAGCLRSFKMNNG